MNKINEISRENESNNESFAQNFIRFDFFLFHFYRN